MPAFESPLTNPSLSSSVADLRPEAGVMLLLPLLPSFLLRFVGEEEGWKGGGCCGSGGGPAGSKVGDSVGAELLAAELPRCRWKTFWKENWRLLFPCRGGVGGGTFRLSERDPPRPLPLVRGRSAVCGRSLTSEAHMIGRDPAREEAEGERPRRRSGGRPYTWSISMVLEPSREAVGGGLLLPWYAVSSESEGSIFLLGEMEMTSVKGRRGREESGAAGFG